LAILYDGSNFLFSVGLQFLVKFSAWVKQFGLYKSYFGYAHNFVVGKKLVVALCERVLCCKICYFFVSNQDWINETWNINPLYNQSNAKIYIFDRHVKMLRQFSLAGK